MNDLELAELERSIEAIAGKAREFGLNFFPMRFEICPAEIIYTFGAYGMPTRFSHWSFGKAFHRMKTGYDWGLSRIYELVINSDPCYAFLLDGNSLLQNKLVAAHVFAHCDFFKNNYRFAGTSRQMVESMAVSSARIREYEMKHGAEKVETFLDAALSIEEHIDPYPPRRSRSDSGNERRVESSRPEGAYGASSKRGKYDDLWSLDERLRPGKPAESDRSKKNGPAPGKGKGGSKRDLVQFIMKESKVLNEWQRDILAIIREESLYFRPQMETKIMNEGWASLWHARIMRELDLSEAESVEFAKMHSSVLQASPTSLNPYLVGYRILEDIERRYGREKIFEVREVDTDVSFVRNYLTEKLVEDLDLYVYRKIDDRWEVTDKDWEAVRDGIVGRLTNCGLPYITAEDADYRRNGELFLKHSFEGQELDVKYLTKTLEHIYTLWGRPVYLETEVDGKVAMFSYDGEEHKRR